VTASRRWIAIRLDELDELVDERDPTPSPGKDLNPYVSEFVLSWARELPPDHDLGLRVHVSETVDSERAARAEVALQAAFLAEKGLEERKLHALFREGRVSLAIGLSALAISLVASEFIPAGEGIWLLVKEGLIVAGWVAMWKPIHLFLYDWWPIRREMRIYQRLSVAPVEVQSGP
jgi:hypothetical protein